MSIDHQNNLAFYRIGQNILVPTNIWFLNGEFGISTFAHVFFGTATCAFPLCAWYVGGINAAEPILTAIIFFVTVFSYQRKKLRALTSVTVLLIMSHTLAKNTEMSWLSLDLWACTLIVASGCTSLAFLFKKLARFQGPWIEFDRTNKTVTAFKSRQNKTILGQTDINDTHLKIDSRIIYLGKAHAYLAYDLVSNVSGVQADFARLCLHPESEEPTESIEKQYVPLVKATQKFIREWASGKDHWELLSLDKSVSIVEKPDGYYLEFLTHK